MSHKDTSLWPEHGYSTFGPDWESCKAHGMTWDFSCYSCGARFDPTVSRNQVLCDGCSEEGMYVNDEQS